MKFAQKRLTALVALAISVSTLLYGLPTVYPYITDLETICPALSDASTQTYRVYEIANKPETMLFLAGFTATMILLMSFPKKQENNQRGKLKQKISLDLQKTL